MYVFVAVKQNECCSSYVPTFEQYIYIYYVQRRYKTALLIKIACSLGDLW